MDSKTPSRSHTLVSSEAAGSDLTGTAAAAQ